MKYSIYQRVISLLTIATSQVKGAFSCTKIVLVALLLLSSCVGLIEVGVRAADALYDYTDSASTSNVENKNLKEGSECNRGLQGDTYTCTANGVLLYACNKKDGGAITCQKSLGNSKNQSEIQSCVNIDKGGYPTKKDGSDNAKCKKLFGSFCAHVVQLVNVGKSSKLCNDDYQINIENKDSIPKFPLITVEGSADIFTNFDERTCIAVSQEEITQNKLAGSGALSGGKYCKDDANSYYYCQNGFKNCVVKGGPASLLEKIEINTGTGSTNDNFTTPITDAIGGKVSEGFEGMFNIIFKIVVLILMVLLIIIEYIQFIILLIMSYIISALLDINPSGSLLTQIGLPLWQIFAGIANFLLVGFMVYIGSATMVGVMEVKKAADGAARVAALALMANTTYFVLNFVINIVDNFSVLIVKAFGGKSSIFDLFIGMFGLFSKVSDIRNTKSGIFDSSSPLSFATGDTIGKAGKVIIETWKKSNNEILLTFVGEVLVVISFFIILVVFQKTFVLVFSRVALLLLFLITSPIWVVLYIMNQTFKMDAFKELNKIPTYLFGLIFFNFAMVMAIVLTVLITGSGLDAFKNFQINTGQDLSGGGNFGPSGVSLILQKVIPVFIGISVLYFVNESFVKIIPFLDSAGAAVGKAFGGAAKGFITGDVKGSFKSGIGLASRIATGGGAIEQVATTLPKLAVKTGITGTSLVGSTIGALGYVPGLSGLKNVGKGISIKAAIAENTLAKPYIYNLSDTLAEKANFAFGNESVANKIGESYAANAKKVKETDPRNAEIKLGAAEANGKFNVKNFAKIKTTENMNAAADTIKGKYKAKVDDEYLSSKAGQEAVKSRTIAEEQLAKLKEIAEAKKSDAQSVGKADFYTNGENNTLIQKSTMLKKGSEINKNTADDISKSVTTIAENEFYNSELGKAIVTTNTISHQKLDQLKAVTDGSKNNIESKAKSDFYQDSANTGIIQDATIASLDSGLKSKLSGSIVNTKVNEFKTGYNRSVNGQGAMYQAQESVAKEELSAAKNTLAETSAKADVKNKLKINNPELFKDLGKVQEEIGVNNQNQKDKEERESDEAKAQSLRDSKDRINGTSPESYNKALKKWKTEQANYDREILLFREKTRDPKTGKFVGGALDMIQGMIDDQMLHTLKEPGIGLDEIERRKSELGI